MTVTDRDMGYKNLLKIMESGGISADIGVFGDSTTNGGESIADYAIKNEYGDGKTPSRPFTRNAFDESEKQAYGVIQQDIKKNLIKNQYNLKQSVGRGAEFMRSKIVEKIKSASSWAAPLKQSTIDRKGSTIPLIEYGNMWRAVVWKYVNINR